MDVPGKPVSPEKAFGPSSDKNTRSGKEQHGTTSKSNNNEQVEEKAGSARILSETDIKREVLTDEDGSDFETDDNATDDGDDRLLIDESSGGKRQNNVGRQKTPSGVRGDDKKEGAQKEQKKGSSVTENQNSAKKKKAEPAKSSADVAKPGPSKTQVKVPLKVKIMRRPKSTGGHELSTETPSICGSTSPSTDGPNFNVKAENSLWLVPFDQGWRREIVFRGTADPNPKKKALADVYYFTPCNSKLRSMPEIVNYLKERRINLSLENFTFMKQAIYHPPEEVSRRALSRGTPGSKGSSPAASKTPVTKSPKPKKVSLQLSSPLAPGFEATPMETGVSPVTPSPIFSSGGSGAGDSVIINTKRWRKRKALPPDFISTDMALSTRAPREQVMMSQQQSPVLIAPLPLQPLAQASSSTPTTTAKTPVPIVNVPATAAATAKTTASPTPIKVKRIPPASVEEDHPSPTDDKEVISKRVIKRKIPHSPEPFITPLKKRKILPAPIRKPVETAVNEAVVSTPDKNHTASKVVFTFSRMGSIPPSSTLPAANKRTLTFVRVKPLQNPCTLSCPGLQGQVPDLHCSVCLLLFHSQCVGTDKDFVCQRCQKHAPVSSQAISPTPAVQLTNGDTNHVAESTPVTIEENTSVSSENKRTYNLFDEQASEDEQLDEVDLASDDDDEDFLTVAPEVVMASPVATSNESIAQPMIITNKPTVFIPPPPLVRAPTLSPPGTQMFPRLPRFGKPPALVRPVVPLAPPFGVASTQLRTIVSQIPPMPSIAQTTTAPITSTIATILPIAGANVTQIITPIVSSPALPVNLLSNSTPIVVGTQVLTPVSISMPGIAKGTVIYTNNPTLRFLLPSSEGMQSFIPTKPVETTPPSDPAVTTTPSDVTATTTTVSTQSTPITSTGELGITVSSKFLVQKPPLVINTRGKSFCELALLVGKAEKGQKVKFVDSENDVPDEETNTEASSEIQNKQSQNEDSQVSADATTSVVEVNKPVADGAKESVIDADGTGDSVADVTKESVVNRAEESVSAAESAKESPAEEAKESVTEGAKESAAESAKESAAEEAMESSVEGTKESTDEGSKESASEGAIESAAKVTTKSAADGAMESVAEGATGATESAADGAMESVAEGATGAMESAADGAMESVAEGAIGAMESGATRTTESAAEGATESAAVGTTKSIVEGAAETVAEGATESTAEGAIESASEEMKEYISDSVESVVEGAKLSSTENTSSSAKESPVVGDQKSVLDETKGSTEGIKVSAVDGDEESLADGTNNAVSKEGSAATHNSEKSTEAGTDVNMEIVINDKSDSDVNKECVVGEVPMETDELVMEAADKMSDPDVNQKTESTNELEAAKVGKTIETFEEARKELSESGQSIVIDSESNKVDNRTGVCEQSGDGVSQNKELKDLARTGAGPDASLLQEKNKSVADLVQTGAVQDSLKEIVNTNAERTATVEASGQDADEQQIPETTEEEVRPFSPLFTEEELREWDRESVSSNDDEEEYRPKSPILLCAQPYEDGYTRIRSTALTNRGAQLACPVGNCARVSRYRRPVTDLYADQEHAYCSPRGRQLFKQAGRKSMTTLKPPRRAFQQLLSACDALSNVFDYLSTADLLRASTVCRTWRKLASQPHQWATVKLQGLKVNNWKTCAKNLEFYGTTMLDMHGFEQEDSGWHQFLAHVHHLRKLQGLVFGRVPAWVLQAVALSLPQLLCLEAEYIEPPTSSSGNSTATQVDVGWWSSLIHLTVLRIRAPQGLAAASFSPCGSIKALAKLTSLTHLSLTSLRTFSSSDSAFLENLLHLQVLELGSCKDWRDQAYQRLGKLRSLRRLRLEVGGSQGDRGLANALGHMSRLEELTLLSFKVTTSLAASIRRLRHLWHLTIWPDMSTEGAMVVYNTLQAVRSLKKLQSFSWGIIFMESKSTRYSRKSTKYREAVDVDEWWSGELRRGHRAKSIKIPLLKAFSDETSVPSSNKGGATSPSNSMEQGLIGVGHLKHKLSKCLPDVEIYVYQVPENLLTKVYGGQTR